MQFQAIVSKKEQMLKQIEEEQDNPELQSYIREKQMEKAMIQPTDLSATPAFFKKWEAVPKKQDDSD